MEDANVLAVAVKHFHRKHKVFAFVRIGDEKGLCGAITLSRRKKLKRLQQWGEEMKTYFAVEVELLHILIRVADTDESAQLRGGLGLGW